MKGLRVAFGFLTALPLGPRHHDAAEFGPALAAFPIVGVVLGTLVATAAFWITPLFPASVRAWLALALSTWLTRGLHLDGLADTADGMSGGRGDRDRTLRIMKDSSTGAHGACAIALLLLGKHAILLTWLEHTSRAGMSALAPLVAACTVSRAAVAVLLHQVPLARPEGLCQIFKERSRPRHAVMAALWGAMAAVGAAYLLHPAVALAVLGLVAPCWGVVRWARQRLGGLTGDVCGALIELGELGFLLVAWLALVASGPAPR